MTFRDFLNVLPGDEATNVLLLYFDKDTEQTMGEDLYIRFDDPEKAFDLMIAEHFADDPVIEITNHFYDVMVTVDRLISKDTMLRWKSAAAARIYTMHQMEVPV